MSDYDPYPGDPSGGWNSQGVPPISPQDRMLANMRRKDSGERNQHTRMATPDEAVSNPWVRGRSNSFTIYVDLPGVDPDEQPFLCSLPSSELVEALVHTWNESFDIRMDQP